MKSEKKQSFVRESDVEGTRRLRAPGAQGAMSVQIQCMVFRSSTTDAALDSLASAGDLSTFCSHIRHRLINENISRASLQPSQFKDSSSPGESYRHSPISEECRPPR